MSTVYDQRLTVARLLEERADHHFRLDGVRWGFDQRGAYDDWLPIVRETIVEASGVKDAYLTIEPFAPEWLAAHAFLSFDFEAGAEVRSSDGHVDGGLAVSVEARVPKGRSYGLVRGMMRAYGIVYQVSTWTDVVEKACLAQGHKLVRHRLVLDPAQKRTLLVNTLRCATADHTRAYYNTLTNSCLTSAIREIDSALPRSRRVRLWLMPGLPNIAAALPRTADIVLTMRHALDDQPCILTQPVAAMYPTQQAVNNRVTRTAARLSTRPGWRPAMRGLGVVAGLGAGQALRLGMVGRVALALVGHTVGRVVADLTKSRATTRFEPSEPYLDGSRAMSS